MAGRIFLYHAQGFAVGGRFTKPLNEELNSHAATALAPVGGFASSKVGPYRFNELISYRSAHTYISGIEDEAGTHNTVVNSVVEGLNILDVITADAIIARLSSKHQGTLEPQIITSGSSFENLRIAGLPVHVALEDEQILLHPTYTALCEHYGHHDTPRPTGIVSRDADSSSHDGRRYIWGSSSNELPHHLQEEMLIPTDSDSLHAKGVLHSSLVKSVRPHNDHSEAGAYGYAIHLPQVGNVYLGELFTTSDTKRLNMIRLQLGSPITGKVAVAGAETNGKWFP